MITGEQLRAAKAILDWSWGDLAEHTKISDKGLMKIGKDKSQPNTQSVDKILRAFEKHDVEIIEGGARRIQGRRMVFVGEKAFLDLLDYAFKTLCDDKGEILFSSSDDSRCTPAVIAKLRSMREVGIKMRSLIKDGDTCLFGPVDEYRWVPDELFVEGDAKIIFKDVVAYYISWEEPHRVELTKDRVIAEDSHRSFEFAWKHSKTPTHSTSNIKF